MKRSYGNVFQTPKSERYNNRLQPRAKYPRDFDYCSIPVFCIVRNSHSIAIRFFQKWQAKQVEACPPGPVGAIKIKGVTLVPFSKRDVTLPRGKEPASYSQALRSSTSKKRRSHQPSRHF
ncbi:hypothetical protein [Chinese broad-headed pond turtle arterivirus]|uniref:Uncharacterized protein n=1 Tax=Chinese broad-headed pond turtle arterivirus TaxID=2116345 RepID=A0A2P1GMW4_9NIDO|nr:hypothetical protein [Chinese broad-headed pond turtle arterivirus]AVM87332.1 hypothetical protein [Chinese broad-headed pond turtle arterivirus]